MSRHTIFCYTECSVVVNLFESFFQELSISVSFVYPGNYKREANLHVNRSSRKVYEYFAIAYTVELVSTPRVLPTIYDINLSNDKNWCGGNHITT